MSTEPIIETFRKLRATEKIRLVQQLWDEIADEAPFDNPNIRYDFRRWGA